MDWQSHSGHVVNEGLSTWGVARASSVLHTRARSRFWDDYKILRLMSASLFYYTTDYSDHTADADTKVITRFLLDN